MSIHLGVHMDIMTKGISRKKKANGDMPWLPRVIPLGISAYGIYAFIHRGFPGYMFMQTMFAFFDYEEPGIFFFADYLAIMVLFATCGYYVAMLLKSNHSTKNKEE